MLLSPSSGSARGSSRPSTSAPSTPRGSPATPRKNLNVNVAHSPSSPSPGVSVGAAGSPVGSPKGVGGLLLTVINSAGQKFEVVGLRVAPVSHLKKQVASATGVPVEQVHLFAVSRCPQSKPVSMLRGYSPSWKFPADATVIEMDDMVPMSTYDLCHGSCLIMLAKIAALRWTDSFQPPPKA